MYSIDQENKDITSIEYSTIKLRRNKFMKKLQWDKLNQCLKGTMHVFLLMELRVLVRRIQ